MWIIYTYPARRAWYCLWAAPQAKNNMSYGVSETKVGLRSRLGNALRSKKSRNTLHKGRQTSIASSQSAESPPAPSALKENSYTERPGKGQSEQPQQDQVKLLAPLEAHRQKYQTEWQQIDTQLGERRDHTDLLHALGRLDPFDSEESSLAEEPDKRPPGERMVASLSTELWDLIASYLSPISAANLALACRTLYVRLGRYPWDILNRPENWSQKIEFLIRFDRHLPDHLLCFPCATYHRRTHAGDEVLRPAHVLNPLFKCPNVKNVSAPRSRITPGRNLPFTFVQLALRAHKYTPRHGLAAETLSKRWRRDGWSHQTQYYIYKNHLLMRVVSSCFAPAGLTAAGQRLILYSRNDYSPYFSVCAHWKEGELMHVCKCALSHIPIADAMNGMEARVRNQLAGRSSTLIVSQCGDCRPMRRCPSCATEYLVEIKMTEDTSVRGQMDFRYAIIVTRWTDLGDGSSPISPEWAACNGESAVYDSFAMLQKRTISGIFESAFAQDVIPGQRIVSLNPRVSRLRRSGESWY
jgi:hypothetical protein